MHTSGVKINKHVLDKPTHHLYEEHTVRISIRNDLLRAQVTHESHCVPRRKSNGSSNRTADSIDKNEKHSWQQRYSSIKKLSKLFIDAAQTTPDATWEESADSQRARAQSRTQMQNLLNVFIKQRPQLSPEVGTQMKTLQPMPPPITEPEEAEAPAVRTIREAAALQDTEVIGNSGPHQWTRARDASRQRHWLC